MIVLTQKRIHRSDLQKNPRVLYLFGDNAARIGYGGQAAECRDEPNAHGIATKISPEEFMDDSDAHMEITSKDIEALQEKLRSKKYIALVIPEDGLGTGLAQMEQYAPATFSALQMYLELLTESINRSIT